MTKTKNQGERKQTAFFRRSFLILAIVDIMIYNQTQVVVNIIIIIYKAMDNIIEINDSNIKQVLYDEIEMYTQLYIDTLRDPEEIYNTFTFQGLLEYIKTHVFKVSFNRQCQRTSIIDYDNITHLYIAYELYKAICTRYNKYYSLLGYCSMLGIASEEISLWCNGNDENKRKLIKLIKDDTETALNNNTVERNGIGSMFILKAKYNYNETPQTVVIDSITNRNAADRIANDYNVPLEIPEKPV